MRTDSRELKYVAADSTLMSVTIGPGSPLQAGAPVVTGKVPAGMLGNLAPDGKRVLTLTRFGENAPIPFTIVLHWQESVELHSR